MSGRLFSICGEDIDFLLSFIDPIILVGFIRKNDDTVDTRVHNVMNIIGCGNTSATIGEIIVENLATVFHAPNAVDTMSV